MGRFKEVVDECLAVSTAFNDISSDTYNELGAIDFEDNDKSYPFFLFDKRSINGTVNSFTRNDLPRRTTYTQSFYFFNTFTEAEKTSSDLQTKEDALKLIADQYFAELRQRNESGENGFYIVGEPSFNVEDETHNERVIQIRYDLELDVLPDNCSLGSFTYAGVEQPTNLVKTSNTDTEIVIGWTDNATAETNYEVWRSLDCDTFILHDTIAANSTSYTDTGLTAETVYIYKVRAITSTDNGKFSNTLPLCTDNTSTPQSGIAYKKPILTGQLISFATGDDAWNLTNSVYDYTPPSYPVSYADLDTTDAAPFLVLKSNNAFGNTNRFTDDGGLQTYANDYVIDHLTGLGWYRVYYGGSSINWADSIAAAAALSLLTFSDWRVPNSNEMVSIANYESNGSTTTINFALNYPPFNFATDGIYFWTSTTDGTNNVRAGQFEARLNSGTGFRLTATSKSLLRAYYVCRNHY